MFRLITRRGWITLAALGFLVGLIVPTLSAARSSGISPDFKPESKPAQPAQLSKLSFDLSGRSSGELSGQITGKPPTPKPPPRLTISITLVDPKDLKVSENASIKAGQIIADRTRERDRLQARQRQLQLSLHRLKTATISPPLPPATVPLIADLPNQTYLEQDAAIEKAKTEVEQADTAVNLKKQEIAYLQVLPNLNPLVLDHERAKLTQLEQIHTAAVRDYQLAVGKLGAAQGDRAYREYQHRITLAERIEHQNQASLDYQTQLAAYEQRLRDREVQVTQTQLHLDDIDHALETLALVKAPYSGKIRRIKWLGQNPDGTLTAELTLLVRPNTSRSDPSELGAAHRPTP